MCGFHDSSVKREQNTVFDDIHVCFVTLCKDWSASGVWSEACCLRGRRAPPRRNLITADGADRSGVCCRPQRRVSFRRLLSAAADAPIKPNVTSVISKLVN